MDNVDIAALMIRVVLGGTIVAHGYNHLFRGGRLAGTSGWFASIGMRHSRLNALLASVTELLAGAALVVGLLTTLAAAAIAATLIVALITNHIRNGFFIFRPGEGYEYVLMIIAIALALAALGPGRWSLDQLVGTTYVGWGALGVATAVAVASSGAVLLASWRPEPSPSQTSDV
ncbi:MAG: DoxX family protein [Acidimicrobiia bacterium]|nr:DoxX family protein [Acidimicrobiia bacterium]